MRVFIVALLFLAAPSEAGLGDKLRAFANGCLLGRPHKFASDRDASEWLLALRESLGLSSAEKQMLTEWPAGDISLRVNEKMRAGESVDRERIISSGPKITTGMILDLFEKLHATAKTERPIIAYRGLSGDDLGPVEKGSIVEDAGYMNLSLRKESPAIWARHRSGSHPVVLELEIPKGYPVVPVGRIGYAFGELQGGELAIVPKKGTRFEVTGTSTDSSGLTIIHGKIL